MHLIYFDENKYSEDNPYFFIGGILINDEDVIALEKKLTQISYNFFQTPILTKETEMHGKDIFHGKGNFKGRKLKERIQLLKDITTFIVNNKVSVRIICIDVKNHRGKYAYPEPEYRLGLMLMLERFCDFLEIKDDIGIVFGDYERDEIAKSILDFSQFKSDGKTQMYFGRPLGRLIDTIYFTHSHHSRFLQVADILIFLAQRYENNINNKKLWHEGECRKMWASLKEGTDVCIQRWP